MRRVCVGQEPLYLHHKPPLAELCQPTVIVLPSEEFKVAIREDFDFKFPSAIRKVGWREKEAGTSLN